jgi:endonuclease/exonuclease/phosphatase family metal-dependent hydrolase
MKKAVLALFTLLLVGCTSPQRLTVMSYNIHHGEGNDSRLDLPRIASIITASNADLVGLQELDLGTSRTEHHAEAEELARLTGMHFVFGPTMDYDGGKYGDAVLSRFPITSSRVIALPWQQGGRREPRVAVVATCQLPHDRKLGFITTHFDHTHEPSDRYMQAKALSGESQDPVGSSPPAILTGDFNCEKGSTPIEELRTHGWDLITDADPTLTCPSDQPREKIDHIFVKPKDRFRVISVKVIDEEVASDHRPVTATVELK